MNYRKKLKLGNLIWSNKLIENSNFYLLDGRRLTRDSESNRLTFIDYVNTINQYMNDKITNLDTLFVSYDDYTSAIAKQRTCFRSVWHDANKYITIPTTFEEFIDLPIVNYNIETTKRLLDEDIVIFSWEYIDSWNKRRITQEDLETRLLKLKARQLFIKKFYEKYLEIIETHTPELFINSEKPEYSKEYYQEIIDKINNNELPELPDVKNKPDKLISYRGYLYILVNDIDLQYRTNNDVPEAMIFRSL